MPDEAGEESSTAPVKLGEKQLLANVVESPLKRFKASQLQKNLTIPPCNVSAEDLKSLSEDLDKVAFEALEKSIKFKAGTGDVSPENRQLLENAKDVGIMTVLIIGADGKQAIGSDLALLDAGSLPHRVQTIQLSNYRSLSMIGYDVENKFELTLDLRDSPSFSTYDPFQVPTPNNSRLEVLGPDSTWVNGVYKTVESFFEIHKRQRGWVHTSWAYSVAHWLLGIPLSLWAAYRVDQRLGQHIDSLNAALRGCLDIYFFLLAFLVFRAITALVRWTYPLLELKEQEGSRIRKFILLIVGGLIAIAVTDAVVNILTFLKP